VSATTAASSEPVAGVSPRPGPVPFFRGARVVFDLSLEGMLWSRRSVFMAVLLVVPLLFGLLYRVLLAAHAPVRVTPAGLFGQMMGFYFIWFALPLTALFYATSLVADEVEAKTITYLLTRPVRRTSILLGKFAAYLGTTLALVLPSLVLTFFLLMTRQGRRGLAVGAPDLVRDIGVAVLALVAYGALFTLVGVLLRWPLITGLLFLYGWEWLSILPGWAPRATIRAWLTSMHRHTVVGEGMSQGVAQALPVVPGLITLGVASVVFLALAAWIFSRRQYVLDQ
jgi:ABC-2 type transport system permease protein